MAKRTTAVYLYCVVRAARAPSLARVPAGLPGAARPQAHRLAGSLWLITADVGGVWAATLMRGCAISRGCRGGCCP